MNKPSSFVKEIRLIIVFIGVILAIPVYSQELQNNTGQSPLFEGEQLLLSGSYAAAADIFQMADGLDRNEGIVGASRAFFMMGNSSEAINIIEEIIEGFSVSQLVFSSFFTLIKFFEIKTNSTPSKLRIFFTNSFLI